MTREELLKYIDQTLLRPQATIEEMNVFLEEAKVYKFYAVCINPWFTKMAVEVMRGSGIKVGVAIGFPLGATTTRTKIYEAGEALENGADELDMVMNISLLKSGEYEAVRKDIEAVVKAADGAPVKVIIEVPLLTRDEVVAACLISELAGAQYVKTSTGYKGFRGWRPTTAQDVKFIKSIVGDRIKVKAAGGISTFSQALEIIDAGASRIGTSSGVQIIEDYRKLLKLLKKE